MAEEGDLQALARRYLDLWESQLAAMAADSELAEQLGRLFAATNASLLAGVQAVGTSQTGKADAGANTAAANRTQAAAAARGDGAVDVAELERRIAALERRLDALERRSASSD